jgi:hypothetical protein
MVVWRLAAGAAIVLALCSWPPAPAGARRSRVESATLRLEMPGGNWAVVTVASEGVATVSAPNGRTAVLKATRRGADLELAVSERVTSVTGTVTTDLGRYVLRAGVRVHIDEPVEMDVEWLDAGQAVRTTAVSGPARDPCEECCVECQKCVFCACRVETVCGWCCCPDCCGDGPGTGAGARAGSPGGQRGFCRGPALAS